MPDVHHTHSFSSAAEDCFQFKGPLYILATDISRVGTVSGYADTADTENSPPIADAGPDLTANPGQTVSLDGSSSNDPDNYPLDFIRYS